MPFVISVFKGYYRLLALLSENFLHCMQIGFELLNNPTYHIPTLQQCNSSSCHRGREHSVLAFRMNQCEQRNEQQI